MVDVGQNNWGKPVTLVSGIGEAERGVLGSNVGGTLAQGIVNVRLNVLLGRGGNHGASSCGLVKRVAELVSVGKYTWLVTRTSDGR